MIELSNLEHSADLYFSRRLGWMSGSAPEDFEVPGWENLRFFLRDRKSNKALEFGVRGDSIEPRSEGKRIRAHATFIGELRVEADAVEAGAMIAAGLDAMKVPSEARPFQA